MTRNFTFVLRRGHNRMIKKKRQITFQKRLKKKIRTRNGKLFFKMGFLRNRGINERMNHQA